MWQRAEDSRLMPGFWELPERAQLPAMAAGRKVGSFQHGITFHNYRFDVEEASAPIDIGPCQWIALEALTNLPASTVLKKAKRVIDERGAKDERASKATGGG